MWTATKAIAAAEDVLPGTKASDPGNDPRWQAIIRVAEFAESDPDELRRFALKWGIHDDEDLRAGIAACLLEHLLQYHFEQIVPLVAAAAHANPRFANTFLRCLQFGHALEPGNAARFQALQDELSAGGGRHMAHPASTGGVGLVGLA